MCRSCELYHNIDYSGVPAGKTIDRLPHAILSKCVLEGTYHSVNVVIVKIFVRAESPSVFPLGNVKGGYGSYLMCSSSLPDKLTGPSYKVLELVVECIHTSGEPKQQR